MDNEFLSSELCANRRSHDTCRSAESENDEANPSLDYPDDWSLGAALQAEAQALQQDRGNHGDFQFNPQLTPAGLLLLLVANSGESLLQFLGQGIRSIDTAFTALTSPFPVAAAAPQYGIAPNTELSRHDIERPAGQLYSDLTQQLHPADLLSEDEADTLRELALSRYDTLRDLLGKQFLNKVAAESEGSFAKEAEGIVTHILDPALVYASVRSMALEQFGNSEIRQMLLIAQKIEQYRKLASPGVSKDISSKLNDVAGEMEKRFALDFTQQFSVMNLGAALKQGDIPIQVHATTFNEALSLHQKKKKQRLSLGASELKYAAYLYAFKVAEKNPNTACDLSQSTSEQPESMQRLSEIQCAYALLTSFPQNDVSGKLPLNISGRLEYLDAELQRKNYEHPKDESDTEDKNLSDIKRLRQQIDALGQIGKEQRFDWLRPGDPRITPKKIFWKQDRLNSEMFSERFPPMMEIARAVLKEKIVEKTGLTIDPAQYKLYHFDMFFLMNNHMTQGRPIAADSGPLPLYLLENFSRYKRDRLGVDSDFWGIYPLNYQPEAGDRFDSDHRISLSALDFENIVIDIDFYNYYTKKLQTYWSNPKNLRWEELHNAMRVVTTLKKSSDLSEQGKRLILKGMSFLDNTDHSVTATFFDINEDPATDMLVFADNNSGKVVLYMPRDYKALEFDSPDEMRVWVYYAAADKQQRQRIMNHFSLSTLQKGVFGPGVKNSLKKIGTHTDIDPEYLKEIWKRGIRISGPFIEELTKSQIDRMYHDADNLIKSNLEVFFEGLGEYLDAINQVMPNPVTPFISLILHLGEAIDADNDAELEQAQDKIASDVANLVLMAVMEGVMRIGASEGESFHSTEFIRGKMEQPAELMQSYHDRFYTGETNFVAPVKVNPADAPREILPKYRTIYENNRDRFYTYTDPLKSDTIYLLRNGADDGFIDIDSNIEWQARHYDITEIKTWETGIDRQAYAPIDQFDLDDNVGALDEELTYYQFERGHYIAPVRVMRSKGRLEVVSGQSQLLVGKKMQLSMIPYEFVPTKGSNTFVKENAFSPSAASGDATSTQNLGALKAVIEQELKGYQSFINAPAEKCADAAQALVPFLKKQPGIDNVAIVNIGFWNKPFDGNLNLAMNHFAVTAHYRGEPIVVDLTAHQFKTLGLSEPIVSTEVDWYRKVKSAFDSNSRILAKIYRMKSGISSAKFSSSSTLGPFDVEDDVLLLSTANWYNEDVFESVQKLERKAQVAQEQSRALRLGTDDLQRKILISRHDSKSLLDIYQKNIGRNFKLYSSTGRKASVLFLSAHGGYMKNSGTVKIPERVSIDFLGPHGRTLADPGIDIINDDTWIPYATVNKNGFIANEYKSKLNNNQFHGAADQLKASGADTVGAVKNYEIGKYDGTQDKRIGAKETPKSIAQAIDTNRSKARGLNMDVLTVRNRYFGPSSKLSDVLDLIDKEPEFSRYEKVIFSACRSNMGDKNPSGYSIKNMEVIVAERTPTGWRIMTVPNQVNAGTDAGLQTTSPAN